MSSERDWDAEFAAITADWAPVNESGPTLTSDRSDIRPDLQQEAVTLPALPLMAEPETPQPSAQVGADDDFVPPTPAPLNWSDPSLVIMLAALIIGPMWLGFLLFTSPDASWLLWCAGGGITLLGFALALIRQPRSRDEEPYDDGARV